MERDVQITVLDHLMRYQHRAWQDGGDAPEMREFVVMGTKIAAVSLTVDEVDSVTEEAEALSEDMNFTELAGMIINRVNAIGALF